MSVNCILTNGQNDKFYVIQKKLKKEYYNSLCSLIVQWVDWAQLGGPHSGSLT